MNMLIILAVISMMVIRGQAAPINSTSDPTESTPQNPADISGLHTHASVQVTYILQQIEALEYYTVSTHIEHTTIICYSHMYCTWSKPSLV